MLNSWRTEASKSELTNIDAFLLSILTPIAFIIRFWRLSLPAGCVFDEVYFGNFSNFYITSQFYYDIHPPLAKIVAFLFANLSEYDGSIDFHDAHFYPIGDYVMLRVTPATFSALCGPLVYLAVRFFRFSPTAATSAAILAIFDTSLGTEGRHILSDGILHFFSVLRISRSGTSRLVFLWAPRAAARTRRGDFQRWTRSATLCTSSPTSSLACSTISSNLPSGAFLFSSCSW
jgi:dolichyl-phosphate-mannose--protein O-mannosyl transferase